MKKIWKWSIFYFALMVTGSIFEIIIAYMFTQNIIIIIISSMITGGIMTALYRFIISRHLKEIEEREKVKIEKKGIPKILERIHSLADQEFRQDRELLRIKSKRHKDKKLILISLDAYPLKQNDSIIDISSEDFERFIETLWKLFNFNYPTGIKLDNYSNYLRKFAYSQNTYFFEYESDSLYNYSRIRIYEDGRICISIIFETNTLVSYFPDASQFTSETKREMLDKSFYLFYQYLPFLFILNLYLMKLVYEKAKFNEDFKLYSRILSTNKISLLFNWSSGMGTPILSNDISIEFKHQINHDDLDLKKQVTYIINLYLNEVLKKFDTRIDKRKEFLREFDETINTYLDPVFKFQEN